MMKKLVIWDENWSDEFDIFGYEIVEEEILNLIIDILKKNPNLLDDDTEFYFGTNEYIDLNQEDIIEILEEAKNLSDTESEIIFRNMGKSNGQTFLCSVVSRILDSSIVLSKLEKNLLNNYTCY